MAPSEVIGVSDQTASSSEIGGLLIGSGWEQHGSTAPSTQFHLEHPMPHGTVKWFNAQKGYGFIQPQDGGKDIFVHISAVEQAGLRTLNRLRKKPETNAMRAIL